LPHHHLFFQELPIPKPEGNVQGLKPSQLAALTRLFNRRFPLAEVYTVEQARELALLSRALGRQVGLLIDRKGRVQMVIVGEAGSIMALPPAFCLSQPAAKAGRGVALLNLAGAARRRWLVLGYLQNTRFVT
jgi:hypothetical protein